MRGAHTVAQIGEVSREERGVGVFVGTLNGSGEEAVCEIIILYC